MLIGGTLLAQLLPVLLQPILRRIFSPEEFGLAAVYFSTVSILTVLASFNYNATIVLPKKEQDSISLVFGSLGISLFFSLFIFVLILLFSNHIIHLFDFPLTIKNWLYLVACSVFLNSSHLILGNWLTRKKEFKKFALNKISRRVAEGITQFSLGKTFNSLGLILGTFIGDLINFFTYLIQFKKTGGHFLIDKKAIIENLKLYLHFPKYSLIPNLLSAISLSIPIIIINKLYATDVTGQFDLSRMILAAPLSLISLSISQVFLQKITEAKMNRQGIMKIYRMLLFGLSAFSLLLVLIIYFFGEELFVFIFGQEWDVAGRITEILVFSYSIMFFVSPLAISFIALEELKLNSIWQMLHFMAVISLYFLPDLPFETFIRIYVGIEIFFYLCYGILTYLIIRKYEKSLS